MGKNNVRLTTAEFIERAKIKHDDFYDYSLVNYVNSTTKVEIICPIHGIFSQQASAHYLRGDRCPCCNNESMSKKNRTPKDEFIRKSNEIHKNKFTYDLVEDYKTLGELVSILCPIHGIFKQNAWSHMRGSDCEKCSYNKRGINIRITFKEYLRRAKEKHGEKYFYIESSYTNINNPVSYLCSIHGEVSQSAKTHLLSQGCAKCFRKNEPYTTESFIEKAILLRGDAYSYKEVVYGGRNNINVIITCKHHGNFNQSPMSHLAGSDCLTCAIIFSNAKDLDKIEDAKKLKSNLYLYRFQNDHETFYKIGIAKRMDKRLSKYSLQSNYTLEKIFLIPMNLYDAAKMEQEIIKKYKKYRHYPIQKFDGRTECFNLNLPIQEIIDNLENKPQNIADIQN